MTGMKEGAGEDPFASDEATTDGEERPESTETRASDQPDGNDRDDAGTSRSQSFQIPYKFRRESVQEGRDRVPLFLHDETKRDERDAQRELESRFDDSVSLTDLREALMRVGLEHLDEVEVQLEEWGYGMTFTE
jgi:hypothetical protein